MGRCGVPKLPRPPSTHPLNPRARKCCPWGRPFSLLNGMRTAIAKDPPTGQREGDAAWPGQRFEVTFLLRGSPTLPTTTAAPELWAGPAACVDLSPVDLGEISILITPRSASVGTVGGGTHLGGEVRQEGDVHLLTLSGEVPVQGVQGAFGVEDGGLIVLHSRAVLDPTEEEEGRGGEGGKEEIPTKTRRCRAHTSPMAPFCAGPHTTSTVGCFRGRDGRGKAWERGVGHHCVTQCWGSRVRAPGLGGTRGADAMLGSSRWEVGRGQHLQWGGDSGAHSGTGKVPTVVRGPYPWRDRAGARSGSGLPASLLGGGRAPHTSSRRREALFIH